MSENKFAILIGMNNYEDDVLPFCIKDVEDMEHVLITYCRFSKKNIFKITDSDKPVKEQIDEAFAIIEKDFKIKRDLLFFYFSGHGDYDKKEEKSKIIFEDDTELTIEDILIRYFYKISPKNQYLLIDACHSGGKVYFKSNNPEKEIRRLNHNSSELCFMFATESKKKAVQDEDIQNSYFTYFFLEAIKNDRLYDEDGYLTIQAIDNYLKKKVAKKSNFLQVPVSEFRSSGYKAFAYNEALINSKKNIRKEIMKETEIENNKQADNGTYNLSFEESLSFTHRGKEQEKYVKIIDQILQDYIENEDYSQFDTHIENLFLEMAYEHQHEISKRLIQKARKEKLEAINDIFEVELVEKPAQPAWMGGLSQMLSYLHDNSKPEYNYKIYASSDHIYSTGISLKAKTVYEVSCGIAILLYQVKFGFAIACIQYDFDWGGEFDSVLKSTTITIKPFALNKDNNHSVTLFVSQKMAKFHKSINSAFENRNKEIEDFISKTNK